MKNLIQTAPIEAVVIARYFIDLTVEEQSALYARLDEQCKMYLGKSCEELLAEAGEELKEESS